MADPLSSMVAKERGKGIQKEVKVCEEDQFKINKFARENGHLCDLKEQIELKEKELQNLKDASEELILIDDDIIPYQVGEVFIHMGEPETQAALDKAKEAMEDEVSKLRERCEDIEKILSELKVQLYAKFGDNINLEADDG